MEILLTNDDGIHAPGLHALAEALQRLGNVTLVAPALEQSGVGLSITYLHPLLAREEFRDGKHYGWAVQGSPADCVKMGMLEFCPRKPDLVVSGINSGSNLGINVLYSGTVAGAIEGAFFGVTSVAVSLSVLSTPDYPQAATLAVPLIETLLDRNVPAGSLWNMNFPQSKPAGPRGVKVVPMGVKRSREKLEKRTDPRGRAYYWSGVETLADTTADVGTDIHEVANGYATITPLHFDLTEHARIADLEDLNWPSA